jgi:hypothetical protein
MFTFLWSACSIKLLSVTAHATAEELLNTLSQNFLLGMFGEIVDPFQFSVSNRMNIMDSLYEDLLAVLHASLVSAYPSVLLKTAVIHIAVVNVCFKINRYVVLMQLGTLYVPCMHFQCQVCKNLFTGTTKRTCYNTVLHIRLCYYGTPTLMLQHDRKTSCLVNANTSLF